MDEIGVSIDRDNPLKSVRSAQMPENHWEKPEKYGGGIDAGG
jgi:hypothetical protein